MIFVDHQSSTSLQTQIYRQIVEQIITGNFQPGDLLPATRKLALELSVSRNTVLGAYSQLTAEGYVESQIGSGYRVCALPVRLISSSSEPQSKESNESKTHQDNKQFRFSFEYGSVDNSIFPYTQWKKSLNRTLDGMVELPAHTYPERQGLFKLQKNLCLYLFHARGVNCRPEQIVITSGHQYSMEIVANIFKNTSKKFAIENPGYDGTRKIFENHDFTIMPVNLDSSGVKLEELRDIRPDLLYLTPSHQYPTGAVLPIGKRYEILDMAANKDFYVIEDDYDSELRYDTAPIPSLYSLDRCGRTIYAGTFSKTLFPALRMAFLVLPENLMDRYHEFYGRYNSRVSSLMQLTLADFIETGHYQRHLSKIRVLYKKRQKEFLNAFNQVFGNQATLTGDLAGVHFLVTVKNCPLPEKMIERIRESGINITDSIPYYLKPLKKPNGQFIISFASVKPDHYQPGLQALKDAIFTSDDQQTSTPNLVNFSNN